MKKHYFTLSSLLLCFTLGAQEIWLETGIKGGAGTSFVLNKNILDDKAYNYQFTPMYGFGAKMSLNFGPFHGIALEGMYNQSGQNLEYKQPVTNITYNNEINWKSIDAYLLYRYIRNRAYLEIGPMYSILQSVEQLDSGTKLKNPETYYQNYFAGAVGFGGYLAGSNTFTLGLGIRLHYGITNFVSDSGTDLGFPNPGHSLFYDKIEPTHVAFGQVILEFNFGIGHWAKTSCSKRMKFFGSGRR